MPIQEITSTGPSLHHIGIHVQRAGKTAAGGQAMPEQGSDGIDQQERLTLAGLQLVSFEQAYVVVPGANQGPLKIDPKRFSSDPLLQSLQQIGKRLDLDAAMDLHQAASSLIASMRQQGELPQSEGPIKLVLAGAFGEIELELDRLQPSALREAFSSGLQEQPRQDLQSIHGQLSTLSQMVRAGFDAHDGAGQLADWIEAVMAPSFELGDFFNQSLGYNPLNQESSVRSLLHGMQSGAETQDADQQKRLAQLLREKVDALVEAANRLEDQLELAPAPDSPDILDLLRAFQAILRQLDLDIYKLLKSQNDLKQFERKLLGQFAERLHRDLDFHKSELDGLHQSHARRLQLLIDQARTQVEAKLWLSRQHGGPQELQAALQSLQA